MHKHKHKLILLTLTAYSLFAVAAIVVAVRATTSELLVASVYSSRDTETSIVEETKPAHIMVVGDIMLERGVATRTNAEGGGSYTFPFQYTAETLRKADIAFGNLEGPISEQGIESEKEFTFRFPPKVVEGLTYAGFDVLSVANNHSLDYGRAPLCDTATYLKAANIFPIGGGCNTTEAEAPYIATVANTKVAFLAYTPMYGGAYAVNETPGLAKYDVAKITATAQQLKSEQSVDVVFVSLHWGEEYQHRSNKAQQDVAHKLVEGGVDVIIGHHPHVPQEIERYKDGWIIYSLGNFVFDQYHRTDTKYGLIGDITVQDGEVKSLDTIETYINNYFQPTILPTS